MFSEVSHKVVMFISHLLERDSVLPPELSTGGDLATVALISSKVVEGMHIAEVKATKGVT